MAGWNKMPIAREVGLGQSDIALDGDPVPPPAKRTEPPILGPCLFSAHVYCGQTASWIKMPLGIMEAGLEPGNTVFGADQPLPKRGTASYFSAHVCCGQTAGWIKMPLGTKVGLGSGHNVLDGDPAPQKGHSLPIFGPCLFWPNGRPFQLPLSTC